MYLFYWPVYHYPLRTMGIYVDSRSNLPPLNFAKLTISADLQAHNIPNLTCISGCGQFIILNWLFLRQATTNMC